MLSILIPTYNYNVLTLVDVLHKEATDLGIIFEIIVLDDGSSDLITIEENSKINVIEHCCFEKNKENQGRTKTRTLLAQRAKYNWLLFLDADVIPVSEKFIQNYVSHINENDKVIFGGYKYENETVEKTKTLRYKYGKIREEKRAQLRNQKPYSYVFSGNLLIDKDIFLKYNYTSDENIYGLDIYFGYQLYYNSIKVKHIDNEIYHLGIETNTVFFDKSIQSLKKRIELLANEPKIEEVNSLIRTYNFVKKYHFKNVIGFVFKLFEPILKKAIMSKNPSLFCFDLYRLGYICTLKF